MVNALWFRSCRHQFWIGHSFVSVRCRMVVLNLAGTGFVDLGGMRLPADVTGWAAARDVWLYVAGCSASLLRLLHVSDLFGGST